MEDTTPTVVQADEPVEEEPVESVPEEGSTPHAHEETTLAFLLALTPLMVLTFFGQIGLI